VAVAVLLVWVAARVLLLVLALNPGLYSSAITGDVRGYGAKVERMFQGEMPYRDVAIEYPPGSVPFTILPGLAVGTGEHYRLAFALTMLVVDAVGLYACWRLARVADRGSPRIPLAYALGALAIGPIMFMRFDLVPAVCVLLAAAFAAERKPAAAAAALGYGAAAKLFPGVLAPLLVLALVPTLGWVRALARTVPAFLVAFGLTFVPALAVSFDGTVSSVFLYHMDRGVQIESLWAGGLALAHTWFDLPAHTAYQFGAYDIFTTWSTTAKTLSTLATPAALLAAAGLVWWRARLLATDGGGSFSAQDWAVAFAIGVLAFMLPTRVLSPQYLIWLLPVLAVVVADRRARWAPWLLAAAGVVTQLIFPFRYSQLRNLEALDVGVLTARNALLVATAAVLVAAFIQRRRLPRPPAAPPTPPGENETGKEPASRPRAQPDPLDSAVRV
jgi:hypothetical protein